MIYPETMLDSDKILVISHPPDTPERLFGAFRALHRSTGSPANSKHPIADELAPLLRETLTFIAPWAQASRRV
jgi:hypothetical protein